MKSVLRCLVVGLLGLAGRPALAQVPATPARLDSLRALATSPGQPDTARLRHGLLLCRSLLKANLDSAARWASRSQALARRLGSGVKEAEATNLVGTVAYHKADFPAAQHAFLAALRTSRRAGSCVQAGMAYMGLGNVAQSLSDQAGAVAYFQQARTAFAACPAASNNQRLMLLSNLGNLYIQAKQYARAAPPLQEALGRLLPGTPANLQCNLLDLLAMWELGQHRPARALPYLRREMALARRYHDARFEGYAAINFGEAYRDLHQPAAALPYHYQALALARQLGDQGQTNDAQLALAHTLRALGRPEAFDTLARYQALHDTLLARDRVQQVAEAQAKLAVAEKQARITVLEKDRRIQALEAERRATRTRLLATGGILAASLLLLGAGLLFARYRRHQAAARATDAVLLRTRLAADLHDDVGNLLTQISMQSDLLREIANAPPAQILLRLQNLSDTSRRAARQMADVVWGLQETSQTLPEVVTHMRDHAHEVLPPAGLNIDFRVTEGVAALLPSSIVCQHLYLIYKEALHNVLKHARGATQVTTSLYEEANQLCLRVADNAPGPATTTRPGGHGLRNMRQRAEAVGGSVRVEAEVSGFAVVACLPV